MQGCKGLCTNYKSKPRTGIAHLKYVGNRKRCTVCGLFIDWDGKFCPCCKTMLRIRPHGNRETRAQKQLLKKLNQGTLT